MHPITSLILLASLSHALPSGEKRQFSTTTTLNPEYQAKWFSKPLPIQNNRLAATETNGETIPNVGNNAPIPAEKANNYECFGVMMSEFPERIKWPYTFEQLWQHNLPEMTLKSGGTDYLQLVKDAILDQEEKSAVDARIILALIMQESTGNPKIGCTAEVPGGPLIDCGLMQIRYGHDFTDTSSIALMITEGILGVPGQTAGYLSYFNGNDDVKWVENLTGSGFWKGDPFAAARLYNTGNIQNENLSDTGTAEVSFYANDIAARIYGWDGRPEGCAKRRECEYGGVKVFKDTPCY